MLPGSAQTNKQGMLAWAKLPNSPFRRNWIWSTQSSASAGLGAVNWREVHLLLGCFLYVGRGKKKLQLE